MQKRFLWLCFCMAWVVLVSGCARNPNGDIIANKNEGKFEEELNTENSTDLNQEKMEHYDDSYEIKKDNLTVTVDADVKMIEGQIPVIKVTPHEFTVDEVKTFANIFFDGNTIYDEKKVMTKTDIEQQILSIQSLLNDPEELLERYGTEEDVKQVKEELEHEITLWKEQYDDAPDTWGVQDPDWEFHPLTYYDNGMVVDESSDEIKNLNKTQNLQVMSYLNDEEAVLSVANRNESDYLLHTLSFYYENENQIAEQSKPVSLSEEEIIEVAEDWIQRLDIGEWSVKSIFCLNAEDKNDYNICFAPVYNGIASLLPDGEVDLQSEDMYAAHLYFTSLTFRICNGKLLAASLYSPMDIVEVENENIKTMSFDEIYQAFKNYSTSGLQTDIEEYTGVKAQNVTISRIEQKLFRAKVKDSDTDFRMVPVWVFYATADTVTGDTQEEMEIAVINAVDGSIMDSYLGY